MLKMFKIAFGLSLVLAVLKMLEIISCSWLMVAAPMIITAGLIVAAVIFTFILAYVTRPKNKKDVRLK